MKEPTPPTPQDTQDIHTLARFLERQIEAHWREVLEQNAAKLANAYARAGDSAYGTYLGLLFRPLNRALKAAGLQGALPGPLEPFSREWGDASQTDQQRWMWSPVTRADGTALGTLVTVVYHDHTGFRLPRAPGVFGLGALGDVAVIAALSERSSEFAAAKDFQTELAEYLAAEAEQGRA